MDSPSRKADHLLIEEVETKRQELHSALQRIQTLTANIQHLESENSELNHELDQLKKHKCDHTQDKVQNDVLYRQEISDLKQCLEDAEKFGKKAQEDVKRLELQMKFKPATPIKNEALEQEDNEIMAQQLKISELEDEMNSLKSRLLEVTTTLQEKECEVAGLRQEIAEKDMEIECVESQFSTQCSITESLREENQDLKAQLESEKGEVDTKRKGNSLFSEVDDRRVAAENKVVKMDSVLSDVQKRLTKELEENKRLKQQNFLLRQTASKSYDDEVVRTLQRRLEESKKSVLQLTEQLHKKEISVMQKSAKEIPSHSVGKTSDDDKEFINFLQGIIVQKKKETEEAKAEAQQNHMQMLRTELHLTEARNEVISMTHDRDKLKVMNSHLAFTIQEMQHKYEPERFAQASKVKVKIPQTETGPAKSLSHDSHRRSTLGVIAAQDNITTDEIKDPSLAKTVLQADAKENISDKSVRMKQAVDVISSSGDQAKADLKKDGKGEKMKRTGKGTGKYRNVTKNNTETQPSECKQQ